MKHNQHGKDFLFIKDPISFNKNTDKTFLQYCLGATLYMPGTKDVTQKILNKEIPGLTSMVMCFEDAVKESELPDAEANVLKHLDQMSKKIDEGNINVDDIPLTFLRVRNLEQFGSFGNKLTHSQAQALTGFIFPKFDSTNGAAYFDKLVALNDRFKLNLYGMPILEGKIIAYIESRYDELHQLKILLNSYRELVLNIRVGGTDFSSLFGVRRGINYSVYDILTVRDCLSDILNYFGRAEDGYILSAPVWEYFLADKEDDIDHFMYEDVHRSLFSRMPIINDAIDGLLREVVLDKANGFIGKTIIHPSHLKFVNAMQAVTKEAYDDALQVLQVGDGVIKSALANKMNEVNPHRSWARKIMRRADAYGVIQDQSAYIKLIMAK